MVQPAPSRNPRGCPLGLANTAAISTPTAPLPTLAHTLPRQESLPTRPSDGHQRQTLRCRPGACLQWFWGRGKVTSPSVVHGQLSIVFPEPAGSCAWIQGLKSSHLSSYSLKSLSLLRACMCSFVSSTLPPHGL